MKGTYLGEFEEIVILAIAVLYDNAYGVSILEEIERRTHRSVSVGAVHSALERLEEKGFVKSYVGKATAERGGRRKRLFTVSIAGQNAVREAHEIRNSFWEAIPKGAFEGGFT
jgi:DNA-binding PadR family transcriptional regulator